MSEKIAPIIEYVYSMMSQGKVITQEHIDRYLLKMEQAGKDVTKHREGGVCQCGRPYVQRKKDDNYGKFSWYVRSCNCEE